ncbi:MAG: SET domain-containing protein-lysine N-methyltransferase [Cyanobacteria bacterium J06592_8]
MQIQEASQKKYAVSPFAEIWECAITQSKSLYATTKFEAGQIITNFGHKEILDRPNYLTVQISDHQHIMLEPEFLQYINHCCYPNVFFDIKNWVLIALRTIDVGEEFTFFYPSTEWSMAQGFDCICQTENCLETIQGAAHLPLEVLSKYKLSEYISKKLEIERSETEHS